MAEASSSKSAERMRRWRLKNPERSRENDKRSREKDRESHRQKTSERMRRWRANNAEKYASYKKARYEKLRKTISASQFRSRVSKFLSVSKDEVPDALVDAKAAQLQARRAIRDAMTTD